MADVTTTFAAKDESFATTVDNLQKRLSGLEGEVKGFNERVASMAQGFGDVIKPLAALTAAFFGIKSAADTFFSAIDKAGKLNDLSARTGESVGNLAILQRAFENAGSSAEAVGPMINRLQRFIIEAGDASSAQALSLNTLGISLQDLAAKSPLEQMQTLAQAISSIQDPATRTKMAIDIFGKSGGELMPLLRAMGVELDTARAQLGAYPEALNKASAALDTVGDNFNAIKNKGVEFATGLLVNVAPALAEVTSKIAEIDAARLGMILSGHLQAFLKAADGALNFSKNIDAVKVAIQGMADGQISEGLSLMFVTAKIQALTLVNEFVRAFIAGLQTIGGFLAQMFGPDSGFMNLLGRTFEFFGKKLESTLAAAMSAVMAQVPIIGANAAKSLDLISQAAEVESQAVKFYMGQAANDIAKDFFKAGAAMPQAFSENRAQLQPLFDLKNDFAEQDRLTKNITANLAIAGQGAGTLSTNMGDASSKSGKFASDISGAKADVQAAVDFTTGPGGIATAAERAASMTTEASGAMSRAFASATSTGQAINTDLHNAGRDFYITAVDAGREFKQEVMGALSKIFDGADRLATEDTLQQVVRELQSLPGKISKPVLV